MRAIAILLACTCASSASAQTLFDRAPPKDRIVHRTLVAARVNPPGLVLDSRIGYRRLLFESASRALRDNYLGGGAGLQVTPTFLKVGPYVEIAPASVITLWASLQFDAYFGTFDSLQSFQTASANYSDDELENLGGTAYGASGYDVAVGADLQAKAGPVLLRSRGRVVYADIGLRSGDTVFYDSLFDVLFPDEGWVAANDLDVAWVGLGNRLILGARYTVTAPLHDEDIDAITTTHRLGPLLAYSFKVKDGAAFNAPTVFLLAQWWLEHPYRAGQEVTQALPYLAIGFSFYGDLLAFD